MRRLLAVLAVAGVGAMLAAGVAGANVTYDPSSESWFIGRGDVIAVAGKDALVPRASVVWSQTWRLTDRCTYQDGTQAVMSGDAATASYYWANARYAPGNGNITGYVTEPPYYFDWWPQHWSPCTEFLGTHGALASRAPVDHTMTQQQLWFNGVPLAATLPS